jgi:hypothetical protein
MAKPVSNEVRVSVSMHFTFDPTKGFAKIPEEITKTLAVGDEFQLEKVPGAALVGPTRDFMLKEMEKVVFSSQKKAKPVKKEAPKAEVPEEQGAQGSLL